MKSIVEYVEQQGGCINSSSLSSQAEYARLRRAVARGELIKLRQGVYALPSSVVDMMIDVEKIVPGGVVCLYNAWSYHGLSTEVPPAYCIAVESNRKVSFSTTLPINIYYWQRSYFEFGIEPAMVSGHKVNITDMERSVCDAIKYRNKIGVDTCGEILMTYLRKSNRNLSLLCNYARRLRVYNILSNYLDVALQ